MATILIEEYRTVIDALQKAGVSFLLVGGVAVIAHGYARSTSDLDLWVKPENAQKPLIKTALISVGYDADDLSILDNYNFTEAVVFSLNYYPEKIDILTRINLVSFDEAYAQKELIDVDGLLLPVIHLQHLVLSKINTGRPQDAADISRLQDIARYRNNS
jgi:predicted nucleotidyltransferase